MFKRFPGQTINWLGLSAVVVAGAAVFRQVLSGQQVPYFQLVFGAISAIVLFAALFNYWRLLKITEAPISTIAAAAQGYVELHGQAACDNPVKTPYHGIPCVWYQAWVYANIENNQQHRDPRHQQLLEFKQNAVVFKLTDESGECWINPQGAEVIYFEAKTWRKNNHRYVEHYLPADSHIYVIGQLDTRKDVLDQAAVEREAGKLLVELKANRRYMLNRYDHNLDGEIDMEEWELARKDAIQQVHATHAMAANTGLYTIHKPLDNHLFLLSAKSPRELRGYHRKWAMLFLATFLAILIVLASST